MNSAELELFDAIRHAQRCPTVIRYLCFICKGYLSDWDVQSRKGVCWRCRKIYFPTPKVEASNPEPRKATLFQLRDGKYAIILD
jgi:hypothetical protein